MKLYLIRIINGGIVVLEHHAEECKKIFKVSSMKINWNHVKKIDIDKIMRDIVGELYMWTRKESLDVSVETIVQASLNNIQDKIRNLQEQSISLELAACNINVIPAREISEPTEITDDMFQ